MDCAAFRHDLHAFADGELDATANSAAIEHFAQCDRCRREIDAVARLKNALHRAWADLSPPLTLRDEVMVALSAAARQTAHLGTTSAISGETTRSKGSAPLERDAHVYPRAGVGLHVNQVGSSKRIWQGASIVLVVVGLATVAVWRALPQSRSVALVVTDVPARAVSGIRDRHIRCTTERSLNHQSELLTQDLQQIGERLSLVLDFTVVAPDFSSRGFELVGADTCEVYGFPAAHVLYQRSNAPNTMLSMFSMQRSERLYSSLGQRGAAREYFVSEGEPTTVVAWNAGRQTYALCAEAERKELLVLVTDVKTAAVPPPCPPRSMLAMAGSY